MFQTTNQQFLVSTFRPVSQSYRVADWITNFANRWSPGSPTVSAIGFLNFDDLEVSTPTQRWWIWYQMCVWYYRVSLQSAIECIFWYISMRPWFADAIREAIKKFKEIKHDSLQNDALHEGKDNFFCCFKSRNLLLELVGGWPTPLKNMKVSWDYYSQYIESHKIPWFQSPPTSEMPGISNFSRFTFLFCCSNTLPRWLHRHWVFHTDPSGLCKLIIWMLKSLGYQVC